MTDVWDHNAALQELVFFLRNNDVFTTTQRGVTTTAASGTFSGATSHLIAVSNVKNIRSVVVASVTLTYGADYTVNTDYDDSGTKKCRIAFSAAQTGAYTITYDYGSDKIYSDFPREDLTISSFPRIAVEYIAVPTEDGGFGNVLVSKPLFTVVVYDTSPKSINDYIKTIRTKFIDNYKALYYNKMAIRPRAIGPLLKSPREDGKDKVFQRNIDFEVLFNYERN